MDQVIFAEIQSPTATRHPLGKNRQVVARSFALGETMASQNCVDIMGDVEYLGCGCQYLVDPKTGQAKMQYQCAKHRINLHLPTYVVEMLR